MSATSTWTEFVAAGALSAAPAGVDIEGSGSGTLRSIAGSGAADTVVPGLGAGSLRRLQGSGVGSVTAVAAGSGLLSRPVGSGTGSVAIAGGAGSGTTARFAAAGLGTVAIAGGSGAGGLRGLTAAGIGHVAAVGAGSIHRITAAGSGTVTGDAGTGSATLRPILGSGIGEVQDIGIGPASLRHLVGDGLGTVTLSGSGSGTIHRITADGLGSVVIAGSGSGDLRPIAGHGVGTIPIAGTGSGTIHRIEAAGLGTVTGDVGTGSGTLRPIVGEGEGEVRDVGAAAADLRRITAAGIGSVLVEGTGAGTLSRLRGGGRRLGIFDARLFRCPAFARPGEDALVPYLGETIYVSVPAVSDPITGVAADADDLPTARVYADGGTLVHSPTVVARIGRVGEYYVPIALTEGNGYVADTTYAVLVSAEVGGVAGTVVAASFQVREAEDAAILSILDTALPIRNQDHVTAPNVGDALLGAWCEAFGREFVSAKLRVKRRPDSSAPVRTFSLNSATNPTSRS